MNLSKIHHIAIIVSNYESAKDFYVNKLGFSIIRENYRSERKDWKLDLRVDEHTELEIFAEPNPPKRVSCPEACGLRHLAFCVESVEQTAGFRAVHTLRRVFFCKNLQLCVFVYTQI